MKTILPRDVEALRAGGAEWALIDVREAAEADAGHVPGSTFLPRRMLELRIAEFVSDPRTTIVLVDEGGRRAPLAAATLARLGYSDVRVLEGGAPAWQAAGLALDTGSNVPSKLFGERVFEEKGVPQLPVEALERWSREGRPCRVIDIRTPDEFKIGRIPGAYGGFGVDVGLSAADLAALNVPVVVHCAGRTRSIIACQTLRELGVPEVHALRNGTMGWTLAGFEIEREPVDRMLVPSAASREAVARKAEGLGSHEGVTRVAAPTLEDWVQRRERKEMNLHVFDVRQVAEYAEGHVPGARALPGGLAVQRTDEFVAVRAAPVVLVDDGEARAWITGMWLRRMGFARVHVLAGGLDAWRASGRPVEKGRPRSAPLGLDAARALANPLAPQAMQRWIASHPGARILDVDTSRNYERGHVPGAAWLPYGWLEERIGALAPGTSTPIAVTCHNGLHAMYAAAALNALGYASVSALDGGVAAWTKAGLPVETGIDVAEPGDIVDPPYQKDKKAMATYLAWEQKLTHREGPLA
ncbi:MAG: rhodanese-like domain-containing protein [Burkholderiales bacterium]